MSDALDALLSIYDFDDRTPPTKPPGHSRPSSFVPWSTRKSMQVPEKSPPWHFRLNRSEVGATAFQSRCDAQGVAVASSLLSP